MNSLNNFSVHSELQPRKASSETHPLKELQRTDLLLQYIKQLEENKAETEKKHQYHINETRKEHKEEIKRINLKCKKEIEQNVKIAFEDGEKKGISIGKNEREKELKEELEQVFSFTKELREKTDRVLEDAREDVLRLSLAIAKKIIQVEPRINGQILKKVAFSALEKIIDKNKISLHINPKEKERMIRFLPDFGERFRDLPKIELVEDPMIRPGGCLIETKSGFIDARLETQIQKLSAKLLYSKDSS